MGKHEDNIVCGDTGAGAGFVVDVLRQLRVFAEHRRRLGGDSQASCCRVPAPSGIRAHARVPSELARTCTTYGIAGVSRQAPIPLNLSPRFDVSVRVCMRCAALCTNMVKSNPELLLLRPTRYAAPLIGKSGPMIL